MVAEILVSVRNVSAHRGVHPPTTAGLPLQSRLRGSTVYGWSIGVCSASSSSNGRYRPQITDGFYVSTLGGHLYWFYLYAFLSGGRPPDFQPCGHRRCPNMDAPGQGLRARPDERKRQLFASTRCIRARTASPGVFGRPACTFAGRRTQTSYGLLAAETFGTPLAHA